MNYALRYIAISHTPVQLEHPLELHSEVVPRAEFKLGNRLLILHNCRVAYAPSTCPYWIDEADHFEADPGLTP